MEKRHAKREYANDRLDVFDQLTGTLFGSIVNISDKGFLLLSSSEMTPGSVHQLRIRMQSPIHGRNELLLASQTVWSSPTAEPGSNWSGHKVIAMDQENKRILIELMKQWRDHN